MRQVRRVGEDRCRAARRAGLVKAGFTGLEPPGEAVADVAFQLEFKIIIVQRPAFAFTGSVVVVDAVALFALTRYTIAKPIGDRAGHRCDRVGIIVIARAELEVDREFVGRALGDDVDRAADGVTTIERALRAAQNFDALDQHRVPASRYGEG